jgi:hypothetical protein
MRSWRLLRSTDGAVVMTMMHVFVGGITIGLGIMRGTESQLAFQNETTLGQANYGATKLGTDHTRSANSVATNNTMSGAIMAPRLSVESANIVMDGTGMIACAACNPYSANMCFICQQYNQNKPRGTAKQIWSRLKQALLWEALSSLSGQMDKMASAKATELIASKVAAVDPGVTMSTEDPSTSSDIWGGNSIQEACTLATKDAEKSPVQDSPFPMLMQNLLPGMPTALLAMLGSKICGGLGSLTSGNGSAGSGDSPNLSALPSVAKQTQADCDSIENEITASMASWRTYGIGGNNGRYGDDGDGNGDGDDGTGGSGTKLSLTPTQQSYLTCSTPTSTAASSGGRGSRSAPTQLGSGGGSLFHYNGQLCSYDINKCMAAQTTANSNKYLDSIGLPGSVGSGLSGMASMVASGQSTRAPADSSWNTSSSFQACSHASKPVDDSVISLTRSMKQVSSFFTAADSNVLTQTYDYASCAKWYFPDGSTSMFSGVEHDEQPFTAGWTGGPTWQGK